MRVLIPVIHFPVDLDNIKGGVHSALKNLLSGFSHKNITARVISFNNNAKNGQVVKFSENIDIVYVNEGPFPFHSLNYFFTGPFKLRKQIREFKPDLIHYEIGNAFLLTGILGLKKTPHLLTIHGIAVAEGKSDVQMKRKVSSYFNEIMERILFPKYIIHLSNYSKSFYSNVNIRKQVIIPNAVTENYFGVTMKNSTENKLIYIGLINDNKNIHLLLQALIELNKKGKHFTLDVLGDYRDEFYRIKINNYIKENKMSDQVNFHGWVKQKEAIREIEKADILVVASKQESLPMVIAECMSSGKAIVATNVGGISEMVVNNVNGFTYEKNDLNKLVSHLELLYNNADMVKSFSENSRKLAIERYHYNAVAENTIQFYNEIINQ